MRLRSDGLIDSAKLEIQRRAGVGIHRRLVTAKKWVILYRASGCWPTGSIVFQQAFHNYNHSLKTSREVRRSDNRNFTKGDFEPVTQLLSVKELRKPKRSGSQSVHSQNSHWSLRLQFIGWSRPSLLPAWLDARWGHRSRLDQTD
jgi:hypothetical protein